MTVNAHATDVGAGPRSLIWALINVVFAGMCGLFGGVLVLSGHALAGSAMGALSVALCLIAGAFVVCGREVAE